MRRIAALLLVSCLAAPASAQHLRIGLTSDPDVLDPTLSRTVTGRQVFAAMCDKLVDINERLEIVLQLATAWRWEQDGRALVLTLREGVRFHDGEALTGEAAATGLRRHLQTQGSTRRAEMGPVTQVIAAARRRRRSACRNPPRRSSRPSGPAPTSCGTRWCCTAPAPRSRACARCRTASSVCRA